MKTRFDNFSEPALIVVSSLKSFEYPKGNEAAKAALPFAFITL